MNLKSVKHVLLFIATVFFNTLLKAQVVDSTEIMNEILDSLYIVEFEDKVKEGREKVLHAEPLYIDLIRDLGARKGEKEWNAGFGLIDKNNADLYTFLIEYEWAPIDRLGLEVELPFSILYANRNGNGSVGNKHRLNSIKSACQYTFFVSDKYNTSMALGYLHEFELVDFEKYGKENLFKGNVYNPFFIAAKRFGSNFHTLIYTGPFITSHFNDKTSMNGK